MTTELDIARHDAQLATIVPPAPGTTAAALDMLRGHAEMMSAAHQLANAMVGTAMVPAIYQRKNKEDTAAAENAAAAILYGAELGLNPIQSLQQVFPIHGQPAIYSRTMVALLKARGYRFSTIESTDSSVTVEGRSPSGEIERSTWTIERAQRAGYTTNKKYQTDPQAMLYAKACAEVCRKLAPDVLLGISHTREDLELEPELVRVPSERLMSAADILDEPVTSNGTPVAGALAKMSPNARSYAAGGVITEPSDSSAKPEGAQVDPAAQDASEEPASSESMSTVAQQRKLAILLEQHEVKDKNDKLAYLAQQFKREFTSSKELTKREASELIEFLERPIETGDNTAQLPMNGAEGGE